MCLFFQQYALGAGLLDERDKTFKLGKIIQSFSSGQIKQEALWQNCLVNEPFT